MGKVKWAELNKTNLEKKTRKLLIEFSVNQRFLLLSGIYNPL